MEALSLFAFAKNWKKETVHNSGPSINVLEGKGWRSKSLNDPSPIYRVDLANDNHDS